MVAAYIKNEYLLLDQQTQLPNRAYKSERIFNCITIIWLSVANRKCNWFDRSEVHFTTAEVEPLNFITPDAMLTTLQPTLVLLLLH